MSAAGNVSPRLPLDGATEPHPDGLRIALGGGGIFYLYPPAPRTQAEAVAEAVRIRVLVATAVVAAAGTVAEAVETEAGAAETIDEWMAADAVAMAAPLAAAGAAALRAALEPPALSESEEACVQAVRAYIQGFAEAAALEGMAAVREAEEKKPKAPERRREPLDITLYTAGPIIALQHAVADAKTGRHFEERAGDGSTELLHTRGYAGYQVSYTAPGQSFSDLLAAVAAAGGQDAVFVVAVASCYAVENPGEVIHIDDVLLDIGWKRNRGVEREKMRRRARVMLLGLNAWNVIGRGAGTYKTKTGAIVNTASEGPLFVTTAYHDQAQLTLDPSLRPPALGFKFAPGDFLASTRGTKALPYLGTLAALAGIGREKPSGSWAAAAGLAITDEWRRAATKKGTRVTTAGEDNHPVLHLEPFTRRHLLSKFPPDPTVEEVLERKNARRDALRFWREAIAQLQAVGVIAQGAAGYRESGPPLPRRDWADQWLDEPLEIHPGPATRDDFLGMAQTAKAKRIAAARKAAKARKERK